MGNLGRHREHVIERSILTSEHKSCGEPTKCQGNTAESLKQPNFLARLSCAAEYCCRYYNPFSREDGCRWPHLAHPIYLYHRRPSAPNYLDPVSLKTAQFSPLCFSTTYNLRKQSRKTAISLSLNLILLKISGLRPSHVIGIPKWFFCSFLLLFSRLLRRRLALAGPKANMLLIHTLITVVFIEESD